MIHNQNIKSLAALSALAAFATLASACHDGPELRPHHTDCSYVGGFEYCETHYYDADGSLESVSRDVITDLARKEEQVLQGQARHYAEKFSLSEEQGLKIAKTVHDYNALQTRSDRDVADFAERLYGVNPGQIVAAAGKAQAGDNSQLNGLVAEAAKNFNTTPENMKSVVKTLHGKILEQQGIRF